MLELLNAERTTPIVMDETLRKLARQHSAYMARTGDDSHSGFGYAENIFLTRAAITAHTGFQASPAHYANRMADQHKRIGIGIVGTDYGIAVTEIFSR